MPKNNSKPKTWEDKLVFGRYKGKTVKALYTEDVKYLAWLIEQGWTDFSEPMEYEILQAAHS